MADKPESQVLAETRLSAGMIPGVRLMRNNVGSAMINGRRVEFGLGKGTPDLVGFISVVITEHMVGKRVAIALGVECKTATGKQTPEQIRAQQLLESFGGISLVIRDASELKPLIAQHSLLQKTKDHPLPG